MENCWYLSVYYWLLAAWCAPMQTQYRNRCICVHFHVIPHPPSCIIARHGFCLTASCYLMIMCLQLFIPVTDLSLFLCLCVHVSYCTDTVFATVTWWQFYLRWWQILWGSDINMSIWLMLLHPNNNKVSLLSCLSFLIL